MGVLEADQREVACLLAHIQLAGHDRSRPALPLLGACKGRHPSMDDVRAVALLLAMLLLGAGDRDWPVAQADVCSGNGDGSEEWGYTDVRPGGLGACNC